MINYDEYYKYICDVVKVYRETDSLTGISMLAKKYKVKAMTKEQFFRFKLDRYCEYPFDESGVLLRSAVDRIRDEISKLNKKKTCGIESIISDVKVFAEIKKLPAVQGSPYKYALVSDCAIDDEEYFEDMGCLLINSHTKKEAVQSQVDFLYSMNDGIRVMYEFNVPTLCYEECMGFFRLAFVKCCNNGTSMWLAQNEEVLHLLAKLAKIVG